MRKCLHSIYSFFLLSCVGISLMPFFVYANGATDAMMVYDTLNGFSIPKYRLWDGNSWGPEMSASPVHGTEIYHMQIKYSPTRNEAVLVVLTNTGEVQAQVFNGGSWGSSVTLSTVGDTLGNPNGGSLYRGFDVEYEQVSGNAIVVAADNTADPNYYVWNGSNWSNGVNIDIPTTGRPYWIELASHPGTDDIAMITLDSNSDVYGMRWVGSGWNNMGVMTAWETSASASTKKAIDVAFEKTSGDILFAWGNSSSIKYVTYTGGQLSPDKNISNPHGGVAQWIKLAPNPVASSNQIMLGVTDNSGDLNTVMWDGTTFSSFHPEHSTTLENGGLEMDFDITFETHPDNLGDAWLVWSDGTQVSQKLWDGATNSWQAATSFGDDNAGVLLNAHPNNGAVIAGMYEDDTSSTDDIIESHLTNGGQLWSSPSQVWNGGVRRNMGINRMTQDVQSFAGSNQAMLVYVTDDSITYPQYRRWNGALWSSPLSASPINGELRHMVLKTSPKRDEAVLVTLGNNGRIEAQVWNGTTSSWSNTVLLSTVSDSNGDSDAQSLYRSFDVEYENNSGDAVVVFGDGTADPSYVVWNGSSWSPATKIDIPNTGRPNWIELASRPGTDELAMILIDSNIDIYGMRWTGSLWDNMGAASVWDSTGSLQTRKSVDVAYETKSGDIMFIWGDSQKKYQYYRTFSALTLSATTPLALMSSFSNGLVAWTTLASNPLASSNQIMYGMLDDSGSINTFMWSGTAWSAVHPEHTASAETVSCPAFSLAFETHISNPGDAWLVFGDGNTLTRKLWDGATFSWSSSVTTQGDDTDSVFLAAQPISGAMFMLAHESSTSASSNITENRLLNGVQTWGSPSIVSSGPVTRTGLPLTKVAIAAERYRSPTYTLHHYSFFKNSNSTDVGALLAPQNTPALLLSSGSSFRLRTLIRVDTNGILTNAQQFKLQFAEKVGTCDTSYVGENYQDVTTTSRIAFRDNMGASDNTLLTANVSDPLDGARVIVNQSYEEENPFSNSQTPILSGQDGKWDFSLFDNNAPAKTTYCFRVVKMTNSGLINSSTVIPEITTSDATGVFVDILNPSNISVPNPSTKMTDATVTLRSQTVNGYFSTINEKIRVSNSTGNPQWTLTLAANNGATAFWHGLSRDYDYNDISPTVIDGPDVDNLPGRLSLNPSIGSLSGTCTTSGIMKGSPASFSEGTVDSVTLLTAGLSSGVNCYVDILGIPVSQTVPGELPPDSYTLDMTLTVTSI